MYGLTHDGESVGTTQLESGDPLTHSVSGAFINLGGPKALAAWIKSVGGQEDDGVVFIELQKDFALLDQAGNAIAFEEGNLISVPAEDEAFLDIVGLSAEAYKTYFAGHILAMSTKP